MGLRQYLKGILPADLVPGNVGNITSVVWPFWYPVNTTMQMVLNGANYQYTLQPNLFDNRFFQVDAEAGFLMVSMAVVGGPAAISWRNQPITVDIRDRQSTRNLMNTPVPINSIGDKEHPLTFSRPFFVQPRGIVEVNFSTFYGQNVNPLPPNITRTISTTAVSGNQLPVLQLQFFGYRVRVQDQEKILSPVFPAGA